MLKQLLVFTLCISYFFVAAQEAPQLESYTLKNGMKIYLLQYGKIPAVNVRLVINSGKKNESPGQQGYNEICAELLLKGNSKYTEEVQNDMAFRMGSEINANTSYDHTRINASFLSKDFALGMDLFSAAIIHPLFTKEKTQQYISYLIDYNDLSKMNSSDLANVFSEFALFGSANPLGRHSYKNQLTQISSEKIKAFHAFNYTPKNTSLLVCGNFNPTEIKLTIDNYFGNWQAPYAGANGVVLDEPTVNKREIAFIHRSNATQATLQWNKTGPSVRDKDYLSFRVANEIFSHVIFTEIREKAGKTYATSSIYQPSQFANLLLISCSVRNTEMLNTLSLFDKTLQYFHEAKITAEDFEKAVNNFRINIISAESPSDILTIYDPVVFDFQKRKNILSDLKNLKIEDVQKAIKKYFNPDTYKLVIAGNEKELEHQLIEFKNLIRYKPSDLEKDN